MALDDIIKGVTDALSGDDKKQPGANDQGGGLLGTIAQLLTGSNQSQQDQQIRPASEDPLGDPADQAYNQNIRPASEDPLGDPAGMPDGQTVLPASQDPLGDPADQIDHRSVRPASEDPRGDPADQETR
jgi:hypothetical protein